MSATVRPVESYLHVFWDWNGTIVDDAWLCVDVMNGMLRRRGMRTITLEQYQEDFGFPVKSYYERIGFEFDEEPFEGPGTEFMDGYRARWREARLQPGAAELLRAVEKAGVGQSLLSAAIQDLLEEMVGFFEVRPHFQALLGTDNHYANGKIDIGREAMGRLGLDTRNALLIGDTTHDAEVAEEMGVDCVLVCGGHQTRERLATTGAPFFHSLKDLREAISTTTRRLG